MLGVNGAAAADMDKVSVGDSYKSYVRDMGSGETNVY